MYRRPVAMIIIRWKDGDNVWQCICYHISLTTDQACTIHLRMLINSPIPLTLAAWWKYPAVIAFLKAAQKWHSERIMESCNIPQNVEISSSRYELHPSKFQWYPQAELVLLSPFGVTWDAKNVACPNHCGIWEPSMSSYKWHVTWTTYPWLFHWLRTFSNVKWSLSSTLNFSLAASASSILSLGL